MGGFRYQVVGSRVCCMDDEVAFKGLGVTPLRPGVHNTENSP